MVSSTEIPHFPHTAYTLLGPNGVRGTRFFDSVHSSCFPCATGLAASFDLGLVERVGRAIGQEALAKGVHCVLGPTCNIQRSPLSGRGFEVRSLTCFKEGQRTDELRATF